MTKEEIKQFIENGIYSRFLDGRGQTAYGESTVIRIVHDILKQVKNNSVLDDVSVLFSRQQMIDFADAHNSDYDITEEELNNWLNKR